MEFKSSRGVLVVTSELRLDLPVTTTPPPIQREVGLFSRVTAFRISLQASSDGVGTEETGEEVSPVIAEGGNRGYLACHAFMLPMPVPSGALASLFVPRVSVMDHQRRTIKKERGNRGGCGIFSSLVI